MPEGIVFVPCYRDTKTQPSEEQALFIVIGCDFTTNRVQK